MTEEKVNDQWQTPRGLFNLLSRELGGFDLDAAASADNRLVPNYLSGPCVKTLQSSVIGPCGCGLCWPWPGGGFVWCNPPYSNIGPWVSKAIREAHESRATTALLLLSDTSTDWFARGAAAAYQTRLLLGRVAFVDPTTGKPTKNNRAGSVLFIIGPDIFTRPAGHIVTWDWRRALKDMEENGL